MTSPFINSNKRSYSPGGNSSDAIIWDMNAAHFASWVRSLPVFAQDQTFQQTLLPNLVKSVTPLLPKQQGENDDHQQPPAAKRIKTMDDASYSLATPQQPQQPQARHDPYNVWIGQASEQDDEIPDTFGAICVQLTWKGLLHALTCNNTELASNTQPHIKKLTTALHRAIQSKMEVDFLDTTPERIRELLCRDVSPGEFQAIRKRVHDTVVLGQGLHVSTENQEDAPVTARAVVSDVEKVRLYYSIVEYILLECTTTIATSILGHVQHSAKNANASSTHITLYFYNLVLVQKMQSVWQQ